MNKCSNETLILLEWRCEMKLFQFIKCEECNMEYKIIWDDENFQQPIKCAGCGADDPEVLHSGFMS